MRVFVDTSALYALLDSGDENHKRAAAVLGALRDREATLVTSNYVVLEATALLQSRLGLRAVRSFNGSILPLVEVVWITAETHSASASAHLLADRGKLSLVDCTSFRVMHDAGISEVFSFHRHFAQQGFRIAG